MLPEHILASLDLSPKALASLACVNVSFKDHVSISPIYIFVQDIKDILSKLDKVENNWTITITAKLHMICFFKLRGKYQFTSVAGYKDAATIDNMATLDQLFQAAFSNNHFYRFIESIKHNQIRPYCYGVSKKVRFYRHKYVEQQLITAQSKVYTPQTSPAPLQAH